MHSGYGPHEVSPQMLPQGFAHLVLPSEDVSNAIAEASLIPPIAQLVIASSASVQVGATDSATEAGRGKLGVETTEVSIGKVILLFCITSYYYL